MLKKSEGKFAFKKLPTTFAVHLGNQGVVPERPNGTDCKSVGVCLRWFESIPPHII